jgi:hypothetical protein
VVTLITVLAFLHVAAGASWFGALMFLISVLGPGVRTFTPQASLEFLTKVGPGQLRFFLGAATATIVFGLALVFDAFGSDASAWPSSIDVGMVLGLLAYLIAAFVAAPAFRNADKVAHEITSSQGPPPLELTAKLGAYLKRGSMAATAVGVVLFLTLIFMVGAAF